MPVNIGPRIGIEGEDEYRKQIMNLVQSTKTLDAQMKALEATSDKEATAQEKAAKKAELLSQKQEEQKKRIEKLNKMVEDSAKATGENSTQTLKWKEALANAETELNKTNTELENAQAAADGYSTEAEDATGKTSEFVTELSKMEAQKTIADILGQIGDKFAELGEKALDAAKELDQGYDTIIKKTGASGEALADMQNIADDIYGSMPSEMEDVGTAVGEVNTRFGLTGDQLKDVSKTFLEFSKITDTDVNTAVGSTAKILKAFGGDVEDADKLLGYFAKQSQQTGIDTGTLMSSLEQNGATMREMGFDVQESAKLLASFEANGVDASAAMTGFKKAIANGAKEGKDANTVIAEMVDSIQNASTDTEALAIATELFGTRGAVVMADGIRDGRINLDDLSDSLDNYGNVVSDTFEATLDPWDKSAVAINNVKIAGKELAGEALAAIEPLLDEIVKLVQGAVKWFRNLPDPVKKVIGMIGLLGVGAGKVLPKVSSLFSTIQQFKSAKAIIELSKLQNAAAGAGGALGSAGTSAGGLSSALGILASPLGIGTIAVTGLGAALAGLAYSMQESIQAEYGLTEEQKKLNAEIDAAYQEYQNMTTARDEAVNATQAEWDYIDKLADEYDTLIDANGRVRQGYEDRANFILNELSQATGKSIEDIQSEMDATGKLGDSIREVIDLKRAEATLAAYDESYSEAKRNAKTAEEQYTAALAASTEAEEKYNQAISGRYATYESQRAALAAQAAGLDTTSQRYLELQTQMSALDEQYTQERAEVAAATAAWDTEKQALADAAERYAGYQTTIANYEGLSSAIISGDSAKINEALQTLVSGFQTAETGTAESLQKQAEEAKKHLEDIEVLFRNGKVDKATRDAAKAAVDAAEKELDRLDEVGKGAAQGLADGIEHNSDVVQRKGKQIGILAVNSVADGAETHSPSRATQRTGKDIDTGLNQGMEAGKGGVTTKGKEVGTAATNAVASIGTSTVSAHGLAISNALGSGMTAGRSGVEASGKGVADAAYSGVGSKSGSYKGLGQSGVSSFNTGIESKEGATESSAGVIADASAKMQVDSKQSINWGANLVINFAKGMNQAAWRVSDAVDNVVKPINNKLKHSVPKEGPLSTELEWGGHLIDNLVKGMTDSLALRTLNNAANRVSIAAMPTMQLPAGNTTNQSLTYGDIVVNVNGANVQNDAALAKMVSDQIFRRVQAQKAVWS